MRVLLFLCACFPVLLWAEPMASPMNSVQINHSGASGNIQQLQQILRDPTMMGGGFRQALSGLSNTGNKIKAIVEPIIKSDVDKEGELLLPDIEMQAKVLSKTSSKHHQVVFKVLFKTTEQYFHFKQGERATMVVDNKVVTLEVQEISQHRVRLKLMPFNQVLFF